MQNMEELEELGYKNMSPIQILSFKGYESTVGDIDEMKGCPLKTTLQIFRHRM